MEDIISTKKENEEIRENNSNIITENEKQENNKDNLVSLINSLIDFEEYLKSIKNINDILTKENIYFFKKLMQKENVKINLLLSKIYMNIISNNSLYDDYLITLKEEDEDKIEILFELVENCISIIQSLQNFIISSDLHAFKNKIIDLLKYIFYNCKTKIKNEEKLNKISELINDLPIKFFSNSFLELNNSKELNEIYKTKEINKITDFEEKFSEINNYYEQYEIFKKFMEYNSGKINKSSINEEELISENNQNPLINDEINFYIQYGTLILKFCKYHNYMFLDKEEEKEKEEEDSDDENQNIRVIFLFDKLVNDKNDENIDKDKKIQNFLKNKQFVSILDSKEYKKLIKKEINHYLKITKNLQSIQKIKIVREHLTYYLATLDVESYYPLYLKDFSKITFSDNFIPSCLTNVQAGSINKFYFETPENEDNLIYIEFSLEDKTKDINFELNKYENNNNKFISLFKEEKIKDTFKFLIFSHGYSLYEIVFDNYYSWFISKDINYRITILKLIDIAKKEREYDYIINGVNYYLNINEINQNKKNKERKEINIPIIINLNKIKIGFFNNNENDKNNDKNEDKLILNEFKEEEEKIIPKYTFNYLIINILKKNKIKKDNKQKIIVSIFSLNKDLLLKFPELKDQINNENKDENFIDSDNETYNESDNENDKYIKNLGFLPDIKIEDYNLEYKLYSRNEQILIYHMFLTITKNIKIAKTILLIEFDELTVNGAIYNKGEIIIKLKDKNFNNINIDNIDEILYLIKTASNNFDGLELILSSNKSIEEENKKKLLDATEKIKKYCQEIINPPIKIYEYDQNDICQNVIKYTNLIYNN